MKALKISNLVDTPYYYSTLYSWLQDKAEATTEDEAIVVLERISQFFLEMMILNCRDGTHSKTVLMTCQDDCLLIVCGATTTLTE